MRRAVRIVGVVVEQWVGPVRARAVIRALVKELTTGANRLMVAIVRVRAFVVDVFRSLIPK